MPYIKTLHCVKKNVLQNHFIKIWLMFHRNIKYIEIVSCLSQM